MEPGQAQPSPKSLTGGEHPSSLGHCRHLLASQKRKRHAGGFFGILKRSSSKAKLLEEGERFIFLFQVAGARAISLMRSGFAHPCCRPLIASREQW